jgi:endonuclease/exonuclease/phosphatase (EEP) superfamily protein YafD
MLRIVMAKWKFWRKVLQEAPGTGDVPREGKVRRRVGKAVVRLSWTYLIVLIGFWTVMRWAGDRWWLGTLILFGPVWVTALPLAVLVPGAAMVRRRSLRVLGPAAFVAFFGVMGVCVPWRTWISGEAKGARLRVLTCNVHGWSAGDAALTQLILDTKPDIVLFQEWPTYRDPPELGGGHWQVRRDGELFIASRYRIILAHYFPDLARGNSGGAAARYAIDGPGGAFSLFNVHLASPHGPFNSVIWGKPEADEQLDAHIAIRTWQSEQLTDAALSDGPSAVLAGDFNTPGEGGIYRAYWAHFSDAFSAAGFGTGHTYFGEGAAVRIDHIFMGEGWRCVDCRVAGSIGSPHHPLIADLVRAAPEAGG